jgi:hypothetical protein
VRPTSSEAGDSLRHAPRGAQGAQDAAPDQEDGYTCRCRVFTPVGKLRCCPLCGLPCLKDNESHAPLRLNLTYWPIWREP